MVAIASLEFNLYVITTYASNQQLGENVSKMDELRNLYYEKSLVAPV